MKLFEHVNIESLNFDLETDESGVGRYYITPQGNRYPSVTTILSKTDKSGLKDWRDKIGDEAADKIVRIAIEKGQILHDSCEKYLKNELTREMLPDIMPDSRMLFMALKKKLDINIGKVYCIEQALYSDSLKLAGRVDCIAEWNGKLSIIDFKNSVKKKREQYIKNYFMQCTAYAMMFEELTGTPIEQIVVLVAVNGDREAQIFEKNKEIYIKDLKEVIENFWR